MCGAEFERVINEMTKDGPCPYCENKQVLAGYNGLKTTRPDIAKEWGIDYYLLGIGGPEDYKHNSTKQIYWKCHKWGTRYKMSVEDRAVKDKRGQESCWKCSVRMKNILKFFNI